MPTAALTSEILGLPERGANRGTRIAASGGYVPGVCNIGAAEIARRKRSGWIGVAATIALWAMFILLDVPAEWRLTLFLPATIAAAGFLQSYTRFCAYFGFASLFNFEDVGNTAFVTDAEDRKKDLRKAWQIVWPSLALGVFVAWLGYVV